VRLSNAADLLAGDARMLLFAMADSFAAWGCSRRPRDAPDRHLDKLEQIRYELTRSVTLQGRWNQA